MGLASTLGVIVNRSKEIENRKAYSLVTLGTVISSAVNLLQRVVKRNDSKELYNVRDQQYRIKNDFLHNEQISAKSTNDSIQDVNKLILKEKGLRHKIENKRTLLNVSLDLAIALISGMYVNQQIQVKSDGMIDGKSLSDALMNLQNTREIAGLFVTSAQGLINAENYQKELDDLSEKVKDIMKQMEEKVYPIKGANHPFNSIQITDFTGKFYPKKNYETDEINYGITLKIPEFSIQRGDVVLLSGESGTGKSTFLRLLKRGDINNQNVIKLDNGEIVDSLGEEYISFRPSTNLGNETNVLYQITGKHNISDLSDQEKFNLLKVLNELKFDSSELLEELASKKFMEFSTGQQRRLALSKVFYRINDATSVIIVDEPVGNVEDNLIREQLELIKKYAERKNVMLILTTHRIDLAEDLATKRYNINSDGVIEEIPTKKIQEDELSLD